MACGRCVSAYRAGPHAESDSERPLACRCAPPVLRLEARGGTEHGATSGRGPAPSRLKLRSPLSLAPQWPSSMGAEPRAIGPWSQTAAECTTHPEEPGRNDLPVTRPQGARRGSRQRPLSGPRRSGPLAFARGGGGAVAAGLRLVPRQPTRGPMCRVPLSSKLV